MLKFVNKEHKGNRRMIVLFIGLLSIGFITWLFARTGVSQPFAKGALVGFGVSILAAISLGQNYTASLIPGLYDGIAVANSVSGWIIGDDGWSQVLFQYYAERSYLIAAIFLALYVLLTLFEKREA